MLILASQKFEAEYACNNDDVEIGERSTGSEKDTIDDEMLLYLTQQFESASDGKLESSREANVRYRSLKTTEKVGSSGEANVRYGSPKTTEKVVEARKSGIPQKTQDQNKWIANLWCEWVRYRLQVPYVEEEERQYELFKDFAKCLQRL